MSIPSKPYAITNAEQQSEDIDRMLDELYRAVQDLDEEEATGATGPTGPMGLTGVSGVDGADGGDSAVGPLNPSGHNIDVTAGSVIFGGPSNTFAQDNANLFWDNTNNRLGIGLATPAALLDVRSNDVNSGVLARFGNDQGTHGGFGVLNNAAGNGVFVAGGNLTQDLQVKANGSVTTLANLIVGTSLDLSTAAAGQIIFPAAQNASTGVNTLDDYEEGTWTPVLTFATVGDLSVVYSTQIGRYTRIGDRVHVSFNIITTTFTWTTASGVLQVSGLPFTSITLTGNTNLSGMNFQGLTSAVFTQCSSRVSSASAVVDFMGSGYSQTTSQLTTSNTTSGTQVTLRGSVTYQVAT